MKTTMLEGITYSAYSDRGRQIQLLLNRINLGYWKFWSILAIVAITNLPIIHT